MSHIVVYQAKDGSSGFEPCATLDAAVAAAERMRNVDGVDMPRIFKMEEVKYDFRPYFRVEVSGQVDADLSSLSAGAMSSLASAPAPSAETETEPEAADVAADSTSESTAVADLSAPLEHSLSPSGSLGSVESLDRLQRSVEAFATDVGNDVDDSAIDGPSPEEWSSAFADDTGDYVPEEDLAPFDPFDADLSSDANGFDPDDASTTDEESSAIDDASSELEAAVMSDEPAEVEEIEPASDPLVSVRRGLFGR